MNTLVRTTITLATLALAVPIPSLAQNGSAAPATLETAAAQLEQKTQALRQQISARAMTTGISSPRAPVGPERVLLSTGRLLGDSLPASSDTVLVVPGPGFSPEDLPAITQEMNIMSRIFDKKLLESRLQSADVLVRRDRLFAQLLGHEQQPTNGLYLAGYGALFFLRVDFPLAPPAEPKPEDKTVEDSGDPLWQQTKQQLYATHTAQADDAEDAPQQYEPEKVEALKRTLVTTLKHAANIRSLDPNDSVITTVASSTNTDPQLLYAFPENMYTQYRRAPAPMPSSTVLIIRAKKFDIDAFAEAKLSPEQFRLKVQIMTSYANLSPLATPESEPPQLR